MAATKDKEISTKDGFLVPNWDVRGVNTDGYAKRVNFDQAAAFVDPYQTDMSLFGFGRLTMGQIVPGGVYEFGGGSLTAPGIRWSADTDTGLRLAAAGDMRVVIGGVDEVTFNSSGIRIADLTAGSVLFAGASGQISQNNASFFWDNANTRFTAAGHVRVGSATDADATGEFSAGVTGSGRMHFQRRFTGDGLINDGLETNSGWLRIHGDASTKTFDITTYSAGHSISFVNPFDQIEFHTNRGGGWQPIVLFGGSATTSRMEIRNVADTDSLMALFHTTNGPAIWTQTFASLDFGIAQTAYARLTATAFSPKTASGITLGTTALPWGNIYTSLTANSIPYIGANGLIAENTSHVFDNTNLGVAIGNTSVLAASSGTRLQLARGGLCQMIFTDSSQASGSRNWLVRSNASDLQFLQADDSGSSVFTQIYLKRSSGHVGIATTGPDARLDVLWTGGAQLRLTYTDGSVYSDFTTDSSGNLTINVSGTKVLISDALEIDGALDHDGSTVGFFGATPTTQQTYTISNVTTDRSYDANATTLDEVADTLGTLIADLRAFGLVL